MGLEGLNLDGLVPLDCVGVDGLVLHGLAVPLELEHALLGEGIRDPGNDPDLTIGAPNGALSDILKASALRIVDTLNILSSADFKGLEIPSADNLLGDIPELESGVLGVFLILEERSMLFVNIVEDNFPPPDLLGHRC